MKTMLEKMTRPVLTLAPAGPLDALGLLARIEADTAALRVLLRAGARSRESGAGSAPPGAEGDAERIIMTVEQEFGVTRAELVGLDRHARLAWPRQLAMWLLRALTERTLHEVGALLGHRAAVFYSCKKVEADLASDLVKRARVRALLERLVPTLKHARPVALPATDTAPAGRVERGAPPAPAHHCACGLPATERNSGDWVCPRCLACEHKRSAEERRAKARLLTPDS